MAGRIRRTARRAVLESTGARSFRRPAGRPGHDWRVPVDGRAPRLGPRTHIGHDVRGHGAWAQRDPLATPRWWTGSALLAALGWLGLTAGTGYLSWRRHGGKAALFGEGDAD